MRSLPVGLLAAAAVVLGAVPLAAQQKGSMSVAADSTTASILPPIMIQHLRPYDQRGVDVFEQPKTDTVPFRGFTIRWGAAFTQQFQGLSHSNTAAPRVVNGVNANQLITIGHGFNNAVANLYLDAQLARGIRVALTTYLSSRHHQDTWVKDGYLLIDGSPVDYQPLETLMRYLTVKVGHFEVDYGDQHFRRTDNGNAMHNAFVGNLIMDAFTTEIGGEVYLRMGPWLAMGGITGGEIRGQVTQPSRRAPTFLGKAGFDEQVTPDFRARLTGSVYSTARSVNNTLYSGDRAGSRYYDVMENTASTESSQAWSGNIQPGFSSSVHAAVVNPFMKYRGLEFFGTIERARGRAATEAADRTWQQYAGELVYRFLPRDQMYVGGRYNAAHGTLMGIPNDVRVHRSQVAAGWYILPTLLLKGEYVRQEYLDFPVTDIRSGGKFNGYMMEGTVAF